MKPLRGDVTSSCSCTSCLYRNEWDSPSLRRFVARGSKIDKLYYGKYLPLRERKLLEKLVRTRAVYDDVRNQLLSGSSNSVGKPDLKPRRQFKGKKLDNVKKGSDISTIVGLVDKGAVLPTDNSSECCSCCSCSSKMSLHEKSSDARIHKHRYAHTGKHMTSKSSIISRHQEGKLSRLRRNVRFKTKRIRSDPCACTIKLIKRQINAVLERLHPERPKPVVELMSDAVEERRPQEHKAAKIIKKSYQNIKRSKSRLLESMEEAVRSSVTKLKESKIKLHENLDAVAKKSIDKLKVVKDTAKEEVEAKKKHEPLEANYIENTEVFKIRKDSLTKFKEKIQRNRELKDWACNFECIPDECAPEECLQKIKQRKLLKSKYQGFGESSLQYANHEKKVGDAPKMSDESIQAWQVRKTKGTEKQKPTPQKKYSGKRTSSVGPSASHEMKQKIPKEVGSKPEKNKNVSSKHQSRSVKSLTSIPHTISKHSTQANTIDKINLDKPERANKDEQSKVTKMPHKPISVTEVKRSKVAHPKKKSRQAVRIGSSFSFNIEFYKEKPAIESKVNPRKETNIPVQNNKHKMKTNDEARKRNQQHRKTLTETRPRTSIKKTQADGHPLKRCFCTLKLKTKKTNAVTKSVQSKKVLPPPSILLPYECEPMVCIPGECNLKKCEKLIIKRNVKYHSIPTNTKHRTKSTSTVTSKSGFRVLSKRLQAYSVNKSVKHKPSIVPSAPPVIENQENINRYATIGNANPQKQSVRIGSTFSFDIEFSKGSPSFAHTEGSIMDTAYALKQNKKGVNNIKRHKNKSVDRAKRSSSTIKSRYTLTKHGLRRCFCTSKLSKPEKIKNAIVASKGTIMVQEREPHVPKKKVLKTISTTTERKIKVGRPVEYRLLPHECEQGICIPGECNPRDCQNILIKREARRLKSHTRKSNTKNKKTKSTSSFTVRSVTPSRTKKVQSALVTYKSEVPSENLKETYLTHRQPKVNPSSDHNRQAVRIGSTFSFNVDVFKQRSHMSNPVLIVNQPPKIVQHADKLSLKDRGSQGGYKSKQKSLLTETMQKPKSISIGPIMRRCFCTLKLHKGGRNNKKKDAVTIATNTSSYKQMMPRKIGTESIGTKAKQNLMYLDQLKPYECEPYVCIPDQCDPYQCLERNKKRGRRLSKGKGVSTELIKMKSTSSFTKKKAYTSKNAYIRSNIVEQKNPKKNSIQPKHTSPLKHSDIPADLYPRKQSRQAVRVGSKFSFDIEFYKNQPCERRATRNNRQNERGDIKPTKKLKNREQPIKKSLSYHKSQGVEIKKNHKATGLTPLLKRCFCTLKFQKNNKGKQVNNTFPPQVYTVSRMTVANSKITIVQPFLSKGLNTGIRLNDLGLCRRKYKKSVETKQIHVINSNMKYSSDSTFSNITPKTTVQFTSEEMRSYFCDSNQYLTRDKIKDQAFKKVQIPHFMRIKSNFNLEIDSLKKMNVCPRERTTKYPLPTKITSVSPYLSRCFCTMNMQIANQGKSKKYKLSSVSRGSQKKHKKSSKTMLKYYECEPGICIPGECDPIACKEVIMKRLIKTVSRVSGTEKHLKSTSSDTSQTMSMTKPKNLHSNITLSPPPKSQKQRNLSIGYERIPNSANSHKQVVRVGSNFSFNIEFSKAAMEPRNPSSTKRHKSVNKKLITKGTRQIEVYSNDKQSQSGSKIMEHKASTASPRFKRCFCTLKLQKKAKRNKAINFEEYKINARPIKTNDILKVHTADFSQNTKTPKLSDYECEPQICVPGQCNPRECLELIKMRSRKIRTKEIGVDSVNSRKISTSTMTNKQKVSEKRNQPKFTESRHPPKIKKSRKSFKKSRHSLRSVKPSRQAVCIGSSFSINMDFFKHTSPSRLGLNLEYCENEGKSTFEHNHRKKYYKQKEKSSQDIKSSGHKDSQVGFIQHVKSTMTNSFIKRCFCTEKLRKNEKFRSQLQSTQHESIQLKSTQLKSDNTSIKLKFKKSQSFLKHCFCALKSLTAAKETKSKVLNPDNGKSAQTDHIGDHNITKNKQNGQLECYECEPNVCVPGNCDPYECQKRIEKRNLKREFGSSTRQFMTKSAGSMAKESHKSRNMDVQFNVKPKKPMKQNDKPAKFKQKKQSADETVEKSQRQAVRFSSTYSFDVEFFKEKSHDDMLKLPKTKTKESKYSGCGSTRRSSTLSRDKQSQLTKTLRHRDTQVFAEKVRSTMTEVTPFLKRCFCTLKLHKAYNTSPSALNKIPTTISTCEKATRTSEKTYASPLDCEPYECEPGVCIPGECDPYECKKRIKRRENTMKSNSSNTERSNNLSKCVSTCTRSKARKSQSRFAYDYKRHKNRYKDRKILLTKSPNDKSHHRQAVRVGSRFSFDVEFYKDISSRSPTVLCESCNGCTLSHKHNGTRPYAKIKNNNKSVGYEDTIYRNRQSQAMGAKMQSKGSGVGPIKRCFCTLKLQKIGKEQRLHRKMESKGNLQNTLYQNKSKKNINDYEMSTKDAPKPSGISTKMKSTLTKKNHLSYALEPYECEPGTCVPGKCNPYECEKRIKKRNTRCVSRTAGTRRCSNVSQSTMTTKSTMFSKSKIMQSNSPIRDSMIVEQPRYQFISDLQNKQAVRIGSNVSFNIEFYKDTSHKQLVDPKYDTNICYSKNTKSKYQRCIDNNVNSCESQTQVKTVNKASTVSNVLKRCFCVSQLPKVITVGRVEERRIKSLIAPPQYCVCYQVQQSKKADKKCTCCINSNLCKYSKTAATKIDTKFLQCEPIFHNQSIQSKHFSAINSKKQKAREIETILSYTPGKFKKKASKASLLHNNINNKETKRNKKKCNTSSKGDKKICQKLKDGSIQINQRTNISESTKKLTAKKGKKSIMKDKNATISSAFNLKSIICRCKQIFSKNEIDGTTITQPICMSKPKRVYPSQTDALKLSKSERRHKDAHKTEPKKSKSVKITQVSEKDRFRCCHTCNCEQGRKKYSKFQCGDASQDLTSLIVKIHKPGAVSNEYKKFISPHYQRINPNNSNKKIVQFLPDPTNCHTKEIKKHPTLMNFVNYCCKSKKCDDKNIQSFKRQDIKDMQNGHERGRGDACSNNCSSKNKVSKKSCLCDEKQYGINSEMKNKKTPFPDTHTIKTTAKEKSGKRGQIQYGAKIEIKAKGSNLDKLEYKNEAGKSLKHSKFEKSERKGKFAKNGGKVNRSLKGSTFEKNGENIVGIRQKRFKNETCDCPITKPKGVICACHRSSCECVKFNKSGQKIIGKQGLSKQTIVSGITKFIFPQKEKICVCHSSKCECAKVYKITKRTQKKMKKILKLRKKILKKKLKREKHRHSKKHYVKKNKKLSKKKHKDYMLRQHRYAKEDALRRKKRLASDKYLEKRLKSIKNTRDLLLAADSLYDIAKLGCTVAQDVGRSTYRAVVDPFHTYERVKRTAKQPKRIWPIMKTAVLDSGAIATLKRVIRRITAMQRVKYIGAKLKDNAAFSYLMKLNEKDPRKRMKPMKKKPKRREREPMDFQCSLYMASLRKRPYLFVYYMCPWFYPHFITLLQALKQFTQMLLFLVAVVVWSPCILCTELCRSMMCCCLCTG